jgi:hypothetical protein
MEVKKGGKNVNKDELEPVLQNESPVAVYDRSKMYGWTPDDTFVITGDQFGAIINVIRAISNIIPVELIQAASVSIEKVMQHAVETGVAKEMPNK